MMSNGDSVWRIHAVMWYVSPSLGKVTPLGCWARFDPPKKLTLVLGPTQASNTNGGGVGLVGMPTYAFQSHTSPPVSYSRLGAMSVKARVHVPAPRTGAYKMFGACSWTP